MPSEVLNLLTQTGAILPNDHFVGTSGRHFDTYVNKDLLYPHTEATARIGELMAENHRHLPIDVVAAPAMGGIILSQWTAWYLTKMVGKEILGIYAEKKNDVLTLTRGYDQCVKNKNVLVIEDLTTTGGSLKTVIDVVKAAGGKVIASCVMVNKDPDLVTEATFGVPFSALAELRITSYEASECPLCQQGVPVNTTIGHGKKFLEQQKQ